MNKCIHGRKKKYINREVNKFTQTKVSLQINELHLWARYGNYEID